ncbi:hypothetical protein HRG84_13030 [Flavisolibacter sp. BT320]|nr:hypothetical protein [Flavisolibacter longurius]
MRNKLFTAISFFLSGILAMPLLMPAGCRSAKVPEAESTLPIFLIPEGYSGTLHVVYGEKCGVQPETEDGRPVYRFPENGLLVLQVREEYYNKVGAVYYYVDTAGRRQEIKQVIDRSPSWTTDSKGNKIYDDRGNTTLETYQRDQPVVLIKGHGVRTVKPVNIVNGEVTNAEEAFFVFMQFGVYANAAADTTGVLSRPDENKLVESQVRACKESVTAGAKNN